MTSPEFQKKKLHQRFGDPKIILPADANFKKLAIGGQTKNIY
jgi:hypothetical protein